jgi:dienelactone hydrolase
MSGFELLDEGFPSPAGGEVPAYWVRPQGTRPVFGAVFLHPASGSRATFLEEAKALALFGGLSLLIEAPLTRARKTPRESGFQKPAGEARFLSDAIVDLRRGIDYLEKKLGRGRPIVYVGRNYGASVGGALTSLERRITGWILSAGMPSMSRFWAESPHPVALQRRAGRTKAEIADFVAYTKAFDADHAVREPSDAPILFQFGLKDDWIPEAAAREYFAVARHPKSLRWYDDDHDMRSEIVRRDAIEWIREQIAGPLRAPEPGLSL